MGVVFQSFFIGSFYFDDMKFVEAGEVYISESMVTPSVISNNKNNKVVLTANVSSVGMGGGAGVSLYPVILDLSPINGPAKAEMTNISSDNFRYSYTVPFGVMPGIFNLVIAASNVNYETDVTNVSLTILNIPLISDEQVVPSIITNTTNRQIVCSLRAVSFTTDIKSVIIDLSSVGGSQNTGMNDIGGGTNWEYTHDVPKGIFGGMISLVVSVTDWLNGINIVSIPFKVMSVPEIWEAKVTPSTVENSSDSLVIFNVRTISKITQIKKVILDLSPISGSNISLMTNIPGTDDWYYSVTVPYGSPAGIKIINTIVSDSYGFSSITNITLNIEDKVPPNKPDITFISNDMSKVILNWTVSTDETDTNFLGYRIYRGFFPDIYHYTNFLTNINTYTDYGVEAGKQYYYAISAIDTSSNESLFSDEKDVSITNKVIVYNGENTSTDVNPKTGGAWSSGACNITDTINAPYSGTKCGDFTWAAGGNFITHIQTPTNADVSTMNIFSFWVKGDSGGEDIWVIPLFSPTLTDYDFGNTIIINNLPNSWTNIQVSLSDVTNGTVVNAQEFIGVLFVSMSAGPATVYFDDIEWITPNCVVEDFKVNSLSSITITNTNSNILTFYAKTKSDLGTITNTSLNLVSIEGSVNTNMTDIDGGSTNWQFTYTLNPGISFGNKNIFITTKDDIGNYGMQYLQISVIDKMPPSTPTNIQATARDKEAVITWSDSLDETAFLGYKLYRGTQSSNYDTTNFVGNITSYTDKPLINNVTYYYAVSAIDIYSNESDLSEEVDVMPNDSLIVISQGTAVPSKITNTKDNIVTFTVKAKSSIGYITNVSIDLSFFGGNFNTAMTDIGGGTNWRCTFIPAPAKGGTIDLSVTALNNYNRTGTGTISLINVDLTKPSKPVILSAHASKKDVNLEWSPSSDESGISGYKVCRWITNKNYTITNFVGNITTWKDTTIEPGKTYYYIVIALDKNGNESEPSDEREVKTVGLTGLIQVRCNYVRDCEDDCEDEDEEKSYSRIYVELLEDNSKVKITIYDILSEKIKEIVNGTYNRGILQPPGNPECRWYLDTDFGEQVAAGIYLAVIKINDKKPVFKKIMVVRCK